MKRGYHHGNLRQALLDAALQLIETDGEDALSLRSVAELAGVSNGAPYRHFEDRQALLSALAAIGFGRLLQALIEAKNNAKEGSVIAGMARAYLAFAARQKGLYRLMFTHNHLATRFDEVLAKNSTDAFLELESAVKLQLSNRSGDAKLVATALWASIHGLAMLSFERLIPAGGPPSEIQSQKIVAAVTHVVMDGLKVK